MSLRRLLFAIPAILGLVAFHPQARAESADYRHAEAQFLRFSPQQRYTLQMLLAAAGYWNAVSTDRYSRKLFDAVRYAQGSLGLPPTGLLSEDLLKRIREKADPILLRWDLKEVRHPTTGTPLWVPAGLGLDVKKTDTGLNFEYKDEAVLIAFDFVRSASPKAAFSDLLNYMKGEGIEIVYSSGKEDYFVIVGQGSKARLYTRYHRIGRGVIGFALVAPQDGSFYPERLEVLMSDLFRAHFVEPERRGPPMPIRRDPPQTASPPIASRAPVQPERTKAEREPGDSGSSGTGFFVTKQGHVLTNAHVVRGCTSLSVSQGGYRAVSVRLLAADEQSDLALVKTDMRPEKIANLRVGARLGESVAAFGFPLSGLLSSGGNFTLGNITALSGLRDDSRHFQISAPVQPGNSGGPLLDMTGNVVGVVVGKLNALKVAGITDDLAQNVNFAVKASVAATFLETQDIPFPTGTVAQQAKYDTADVAEFAKLMSVHIECHR